MIAVNWFLILAMRKILRRRRLIQITGFLSSEESDDLLHMN